MRDIVSNQQSWGTGSVPVGTGRSGNDICNRTEFLHNISDWHENSNDYMPFIKYTLGTIIKAYKDFEERFVLLEKKKMTSPERVYSIIERSLVKLGKSDIMTLCPELSQKTVERALKKLVDEEKIAKIGAGKSTTYVDMKRL